MVELDFLNQPVKAGYTHTHTYVSPTRIFSSFSQSTINNHSSSSSSTYPTALAVRPEMCRLPEDVMRKIISYLQQPLPAVNQPDVTWKELNQKDLSTMMRVSRVRLLLMTHMDTADTVDDILHRCPVALQGSGG